MDWLVRYGLCVMLVLTPNIPLKSSFKQNCRDWANAINRIKKLVGGTQKVPGNRRILFHTAQNTISYVWPVSSSQSAWWTLTMVCIMKTGIHTRHRQSTSPSLYTKQSLTLSIQSVFIMLLLYNGSMLADRLAACWIPSIQDFYSSHSENNTK